MLTKKIVMARFSDLWAMVTDDNPQLKGDSIAKQQAWNDYTDALCKDRQITNHQYNNWTNPY